MIMVEELWSFEQKGDCVGNTYFEHRSLHKSQVARDQDRVDIKSMIDIVLMKRDRLCYVQDVRAVRGIGQGLSDHIVLFKVSRSMD